MVSFKQIVPSVLPVVTLPSSELDDRAHLNMNYRLLYRRLFSVVVAVMDGSGRTCSPKYIRADYCRRGFVTARAGRSIPAHGFCSPIVQGGGFSICHFFRTIVRAILRSFPARAFALPDIEVSAIDFSWSSSADFWRARHDECEITYRRSNLYSELRELQIPHIYRLFSEIEIDPGSSLARNMEYS